MRFRGSAYKQMPIGVHVGGAVHQHGLVISFGLTRD